jgi:hypothetical protein
MVIHCFFVIWLVSSGMVYEMIFMSALQLQFCQSRVECLWTVAYRTAHIIVVDFDWYLENDVCKHV